VKTIWPTLLIFGLISAVGMMGLKSLGADSSYLMMFNEESEIRAAYKHAEDSGFAASTIRILLEMENGLEDPATFLALDELQQAISKLSRVIKVVSPVDGFKEIDRAVAKSDRWTEKDYLNYGRETFAQLLFVSELSNNDDMQDLLLLGNKTGQMFIFTPYLANSEFRELADEIDALIAKHLPAEIKASVTGIPVLWANMDQHLFSTQVYGVFIMSIMILATLFFTTRSFGLSVAGLAVNLLPVMTIIGIMSWLEIKLDIGTVVIGGIALGLAVDDTIHFLWHYVNQRRSGLDVQQALIETIQSTGIAIILTSILIAASFSVMMLSHFTPTSNFGLFTSAAILLALVTDLFLLPAILMLVYGKQKDAGSTA
jgi:predicted RND superfamily exporter protein